MYRIMFVTHAASQCQVLSGFSAVLECGSSAVTIDQCDEYCALPVYRLSVSVCLSVCLSFRGECQLAVVHAPQFAVYVSTTSGVSRMLSLFSD